MLDSIEKDTAFRIDYVAKGTELQVMSTVRQFVYVSRCMLYSPFSDPNQK